MAKYAILYGIVLILIGIVGYVATGMEHPTALIPTALGLLILVAGVLAQAKENLLKHAMHAALLVALIGVLGTITALPDLIAVFQGDEEALAKRAAIISRSATAVVCIAFIVQGVRSFIAARRARGQE